MNTITSAWAALRGYKSYVIGLLTLAIGFYLKEPSMISQGVAIITIRAGIAGISTVPPSQQQ